MAAVALILLVVWFLLVAGVPSIAQYRRGGTVPVPARDPRGSRQWWSKRISTIGVLLAIAAPIAELAGLPPIAPLDNAALRLTGLAIAILGTAFTLVAPRAMGSSWRGDVQPEVRNPLVTTGPFSIVRNPILTATAVTWLGYALLVPNVLAFLMLVTLVIAQQIQVRLVEEPYLLRTHGDAYRAYAARTGRFLPGIGRLNAGSHAASASNEGGRDGHSRVTRLN